MSSGWRHFSKGLFYFSFVICLLGSMVGGIICWANSSNGWYGVNDAMLALGFELFFGGIFVTLIAHSIWGMMLEYFYNAAGEGYDTERGSRRGKNDYDDDDEEDEEEEFDEDESSGDWVCLHCASLNPSENFVCYNCKKHR